MKKMHIDTHDILNVINLEEMQEIFGENGVFMFFYMHDCILQIV